VEHFARILLTAQSLGGPHLLPHAEVQKLIAARSRYGVSSPEGNADLAITSESLKPRADENSSRFLERHYREAAHR